MVDCIVELKPLAGINSETLQDPYKNYILSKMVNSSDYNGMFLEIVDIQKSKPTNEDTLFGY